MREVRASDPSNGFVRPSEHVNFWVKTTLFNQPKFANFGQRSECLRVRGVAPEADDRADFEGWSVVFQYLKAVVNGRPSGCEIDFGWPFEVFVKTLLYVLLVDQHRVILDPSRLSNCFSGISLRACREGLLHLFFPAGQVEVLSAG